ncbi:hypothetical protein L1887_30898 [Cichorium endivia]|nr:hypothetical protein L1887_30898 [Cichorium endivia]
MASSWYLRFLSILSILCMCLPSSCSQTTFTLSLTQHTAPSEQPQAETNQHDTWLQNIKYLVSSSVTRAHRLKNPNHNSSASITEIPLFPRGLIGLYTVSLSFGSPSQNLSFIMDTGSSFVWFPCGHRFTCSKCPASGVYPTNTDVFMPKLSSSAKIRKCNDKKCRLVRTSTPDIIRCSGKENCFYEQEYADGGITSGLLLSETLHFPEGDVTNFAVGCSNLSTRLLLPVGTVGFGRGLESLPSQMGLKKFAYCMVSHRFNDRPVSSELVLVRDSSNSGAGDGGISYTEFRKNPSEFKEFYYLDLLKITVGGKRVNIPYGFLVPGSDGYGGTVIDSGSTFTMMDVPVYDLVAKEFENQIFMYKRAADVESKTGLRPCFHIGSKPPVFPKLMFHFKGGANLSLPMADYFWPQGAAWPAVSCMTIIPSNFFGSNSSAGPSIIIGNHQQQNIYVEYDLENQRLGFKKKICK